MSYDIIYLFVCSLTTPIKFQQFKHNSIALNRVRNSFIHNQYQQVHCPSIHYQNEHHTKII